MAANSRVRKKGKFSVNEEKDTKATKGPKSLPQELVDIIIDHLHDDSRGLATSALVSRAWVPSSRHHLFATVAVSSLNLESLLELLRNPHCTFMSYVQDLNFEPLRNVYATTTRPPPGWLDSLVPHLSNLVSVRILRIIAVHLPMNWRKLVHTPSFTSSITELWLCSIRLNSFKEWMEILHSFTSLTIMRYGDSHGSVDKWEESGLPSDVDWTLSPNLRSLEIESYGSCPIQRTWSQHMWLWLLRSQVRLTSLELNSLVFTATDANAGETLAAFSRYLQFLGPSLQRLRLDFKDKHSISQFFDHVDITPNTGIVEWELSEYSVYYEGDTRSLTYHFLTLPKLLSRLPRQTSLSRISCKLIIAPFDHESVEFFNCTDQEDGDAAWNLVDTLLTGPSFPALEELVADAVMDGDYGLDTLQSLGIAEYLEVKLPKCKEMGLLRCNYRKRCEMFGTRKSPDI